MNRQPVSILLIENDPIKKDLIRMAVERLNINCDDVDNYIDAIVCIEKLTPKLIIMEFMLPGMNGFELLRYLKSEGKLKDIYIMMITSLGFTEIIDQAKSLGVREVLSPPLDIDDLIHRLKKIVIKEDRINIGLSAE